MKFAELFMTYLYSEKIAKEIFAHDPTLISLVAVQVEAMEIFNHNHRMADLRLWQDMSLHWRYYL